MEQAFSALQDILLLMSPSHVYRHVLQVTLRIIYNKHVNLVKEDVLLAPTHPTVLYVTVKLPYGINFNVILFVLLYVNITLTMVA